MSTPTTPSATTSLQATSVGGRDPRPLIAHVVYRFDVGGLENGVVNLINRLPRESYRHAVVSLTDVTDFRNRVRRDDVQFVALNKRPGHGYRLFPRLFRLFRDMAPTIVHTRNLAALEASVPAWLAGVPARVHGEHGRDMGDLDGTSRKYQRVRRMYRPFVSHYVALSKDLETYLNRTLGVDPRRVEQIYNGVDTARFAPTPGDRSNIAGCPFNDDDFWLMGTVGRLQEVKDQVTLAEAFVRAIRRGPAVAKMRLVIVGDGPLRARVEHVLDAAGMRQLAWLPGERNDVPEILRGLDCFVLPSLAEGISNTILEAMACGLPVVATRVGGNPELVEDGLTGRLVPQANAESMASALLAYYEDPVLARRHGRAGRHAVLQRFSLDRMVADYLSLYDGLVASRKTQSEQARVNG
ncbi:MAG: TIGR03088 family PEP-CTERM/XrtA system glycosyltransferase [Betaproteobacteria bacterium]